MADIGVKISRRGYNVFDANAEQLILDSDRKGYKLDEPTAESLTLNLAGYGESGEKTIAHSLGYVPVVEAFIDYFGAIYPIPSEIGTGDVIDIDTGQFDLFRSTVIVTATNIVFQFQDFKSLNETYDFYYHLSETESGA